MAYLEAGLLRRCRVFHLHVDAASFEFFKHLAQPFFFRLLTLGAVYPTDVVILLIRGSLLIGFHQATLVQSLSDEIRHRVSWSLEFGKIPTHLSLFSSALTGQASSYAYSTNILQMWSIVNEFADNKKGRQLALKYKLSYSLLRNPLNDVHIYVNIARERNSFLPYRIRGMSY